MTASLAVSEEVAAALAVGRPVVALESTVIAHGLPHPQNLETARALEAAVRSAGAAPATIAVLDGRLAVGLSTAQITLLAKAKDVAKVSRADLAAVLASGRPGATTVAATLFIAKQSGIRVFSTGGIGGVHRGAEATFDVSADLTELARSPVAVVCAGAKAILDLPRTLEVLETLGVPVVGFGTSEFPAFFSRESGLTLAHRVDSAAAAARLLSAQWKTGLSSGIVFANPPPAEAALARRDVERWIGQALRSAARSGIRGKGVTPYLLEELARRSRGKTLKANIALLLRNARVAARIAVAYSELAAL